MEVEAEEPRSFADVVPARDAASSSRLVIWLIKIP